MRIKTIIFLLTALTTTASFANDRLERMEVVSEEISQLMYQAMIDEVAANGADVSKLSSLVPDTSWDQPMRDAAVCIMNKYEEKIGEQGIQQMLDRMEAMLPELRKGGMSAFESSQNMQPEGISEEQAITINTDCGMAELLENQMMGGDFMQELLTLMQGG